VTHLLYFGGKICAMRLNLALAQINTKVGRGSQFEKASGFGEIGQSPESGFARIPRTVMLYRFNGYCRAPINRR
jgi:hypothetical protein